jgi:hypothetical protein
MEILPFLGIEKYSLIKVSENMSKHSFQKKYLPQNIILQTYLLSLLVEPNRIFNNN